MKSALKAGLIYVAIAFTVGFLLGTLRVLGLAPILGERLAVMIELPIMLGISWIACKWTIAAFSVPSTATARLTMGGLAFLLLMTAELGVSLLLYQRTLVEHLETFRNWSAIMGLLAQIAFGLFPVVQLAKLR